MRCNPGRALEYVSRELMQTMLKKIDEIPLQGRTTCLKSLDEIHLHAGRPQTRVASHGANERKESAPRPERIGLHSYAPRRRRVSALRRSL